MTIGFGVFQNFYKQKLAESNRPILDPVLNVYTVNLAYNSQVI